MFKYLFNLFSAQDNSNTSRDYIAQTMNRPDSLLNLNILKEAEIQLDGQTTLYDIFKFAGPHTRMCDFIHAIQIRKRSIDKNCRKVPIDNLIRLFNLGCTNVIGILLSYPNTESFKVDATNFFISLFEHYHRLQCLKDRKAEIDAMVAEVLGKTSRNATSDEVLDMMKYMLTERVDDPFTYRMNYNTILKNHCFRLSGIHIVDLILQSANLSTEPIQEKSISYFFEATLEDIDISTFQLYMKFGLKVTYPIIIGVEIPRKQKIISTIDQDSINNLHKNNLYTLCARQHLAEINEILSYYSNKSSKYSAMNKCFGFKIAVEILYLIGSYKDSHTDPLKYLKAMVTCDNESYGGIYHSTFFHEKCIESDIAFLNFLFENHLVENINAKHSKSLSAIHMAVICGVYDVVSLLIQHKANVMVQDNNGSSPLHYACFIGDQKMIEILLAHGSKKYINMKDYSGKTPLHYACINGSSDLILYLIRECNADFTKVDHYKQDARYFAGLSGHLELDSLFSLQTNEIQHSEQMISTSINESDVENIDVLGKEDNLLDC
jgi:hypothetical protein